MIDVVVFILRGLAMICVIDALLSWVMPNPAQFPRRLTHAITEPMYAPIHAIIPPQRIGIDFSPIVIILLLNALARALAGA